MFALAKTAIALLMIIAIEKQVFADYYYNSSWNRPQASPIISLTLDPQESLNSAFRVAAREERLDDMLRLLEQKAGINSQSDDGKTALMYAARNCSTDIVKALISRGASVRAEDSKGRTALIFAAQESCAPVIEVLLGSSKVRPNHRDRSGRTARDYARENASLDVSGPPIDAIRLLDLAIAKKLSRAKHSIFPYA